MDQGLSRAAANKGWSRDQPHAEYHTDQSVRFATRSRRRTRRCEWFPRPDGYGILHATDLLTNLCWQPLWINLDPSGLLSVSYKGVSLLSNYALPAALSAGKFVLSGRTGGSWQEQDVDNLTIITVPSTKPVVSGVTATRNSWSFRIFDSGLATPDTNTLTVIIDGVAVAPNIAQSGNIGAGDGSGVTTVSYLSASPLFFSATTHTNCKSLACIGGACFSLPTPACGRIFPQLF